MKNTIKNIQIFVITVAAVFYLQPQNANAAWGDFDTSFGLQGAIVENFTDHYPASVAVQPDGKILVTGYKLLANGKQRFFLRRYLSTGHSDASFGNNGSAVSNALINANAHYGGSAIAVLPSGKIAIIGYGNGYYAVWRFNSNGSADTTIGNGGLRLLINYPVHQAPAIAVQNGKLIIGVTDSSRAILLRLNNNGSLDTTFGSAGEVVPTDVGSFSLSILVESGTNNITVGSSRSINGQKGLERFFPDGQRDTSLVFANRASEGFATSFIRASNGSNSKYIIRIAPGFYNLPDYQIFVLDQTGAWENTRTISFPNANRTCPIILAQQQDGKIIIAGDNDLIRIKLNDPTFWQHTSCPSFVNLTNKTGAVLQTDDKMVVAGKYNGYLTLVRTLPN